MNTANTDIKVMLITHNVYAYELYKELGLSQSTYNVRIREELPGDEKERYKAAIFKIAAKKAGFK